MSVRTYWSLGVVLVALLSVNVVFFWYPPDTIVEWVGVQNTYLAIFLIAAIGGVNSLTSGVLYASLLTFAAGGANPYLLGITCGIGIALGDTILFWLFSYGTKDVTGKLGATLERWKDTIDSWPACRQYVAIYAYLGLLPLPNDILMFILASLKFRYLRIAPILFLGGITFATVTAVFGQNLSTLVPWF